MQHTNPHLQGVMAYCAMSAWEHQAPPTLLCKGVMSYRNSSSIFAISCL